jgi:ribosomal protein S28E/S33
MKGLLKWFGAHKVITGILILVLFVIAVTNGSKSNTTSNTVPSTSSTQPSATQAPAPAPAKTEAKAATRQPAGTATTQGAGTFTGGQDVAVGLYDVTPGAGQSGNFSVSGNDSYNEILGGDSSTGGVPKVRVQISKGDKIEISSLSQVAFTPVTTPFASSYATTVLYSGTFNVGEDVVAGRYNVTPGAGQSGNFSVSGNDSYNEILGGDSSTGGVPSVKVTLTKGDKINISSLSAVTFTPSN